MAEFYEIGQIGFVISEIGLVLIFLKRRRSDPNLFFIVLSLICFVFIDSRDFKDLSLIEMVICEIFLVVIAGFACERILAVKKWFQRRNLR